MSDPVSSISFDQARAVEDSPKTAFARVDVFNTAARPVMLGVTMRRASTDLGGLPCLCACLWQFVVLCLLLLLLLFFFLRSLV